MKKYIFCLPTKVNPLMIQNVTNWLWFVDRFVKTEDCILPLFMLGVPILENQPGGRGRLFFECVRLVCTENDIDFVPQHQFRSEW